MGNISIKSLIDKRKYEKLPDGDGLYIRKGKMKEFQQCGGAFEIDNNLNKRQELFKKL